MVWRLGTVPYLNADPLAAALREPDASLLVGDAVELSALVPSSLLGELVEGRLDAALVSIGGILPHPQLRILPEMAIASYGPVRSIQLYCRKPVELVETVALDASSRSAAALARTLLAERWDRRPEFVTLPPDLPAMLQAADAALLIGNPALLANDALESGRLDLPLAASFDLGAVWTELTGLPFVWAAWVAPVGPRPDGRERDLERLTRLLLRAKAWGGRRIETLASRGAEALGLPLALTRSYLTHSIRYDLGPEGRAGMERFCELAVRHGVLPAGSAVRMAEGVSLGQAQPVHG